MSASIDNGSGEHERRLALFGSEVRLLVGAPTRPGIPSPEMAISAVELLLLRHQRNLTRFKPHSELSRVNDDRRRRVPISRLLADALRASLWAAERSDGLIDPTVLGDLVGAGYATSRVGMRPPPLREALRAAPARRPAQPRSNGAWRRVRVDARSVTRPPGVRFDLGGTAKGLAADLAAARLSPYASFVVDAGGDIVIGGAAPAPRVVVVDHPLASAPTFRFVIAKGAVATSGIGSRIWRTPEGFAHHLIDPASGHPAWTGVVQATAVAPSGLEAEMLAKQALLRGPDAGMRLLEPLGGVLVLDAGEMLVAGSLPEPVGAAA
jgi:FAD:protein FMN transferase